MPNEGTRATRRRAPRRHPAEVLAGKLGDALDRWPDEFDGQDRDEISHIIFRLDQIAEARRG